MMVVMSFFPIILGKVQEALEAKDGTSIDQLVESLPTYNVNATTGEVTVIPNDGGFKEKKQSELPPSRFALGATPHTTTSHQTSRPRISTWAARA